MGFNVIATDYEFPVKLVARRDPSAHIHAAYLNVRLLGQKNAKTPQEYVYEFDTELAGYEGQKQ